jgi:peptidoglycan/LPS O-acetylase OafA/YrhL
MYKILDMPLQNTYYSNYARNFIEFSPLTNAAPFIAGIVVARMVVCSTNVIWLERWQAVGISAIFVLLAILMGTIEPPGFDTGTHQLLASKGPALFPIFIALTVAASCHPCRDGLVGRFVAKVGQAGLGDMAFSLYILHMPLHHVLARIWGEDPGPFYNLWYEPLIQVSVAYATAFTIEPWWRQKVKGFLKKTKTTDQGRVDENPINFHTTKPNPEQPPPTVEAVPLGDSEDPAP